MGFLSLGLVAAEIPKVGDKPPDFVLKTIEARDVRLSELTARGNVVLVVLRGWPGYQCPVCDRQVQEFIQARDGFATAGAQLVFVYPGPAEALIARAAEFKTMKGKKWPAEFHLVLDPVYTMVNAYGLRWDAPRETAYPSTFIIDRDGKVRFANVSRSHGGRTKATELLAELGQLSRR